MNISIVTRTKRCMCCGICVGVCSTNAIIMMYNKGNGFYQPQISKNLCRNCGLCLCSCPAYNAKPSYDLIGNFTSIHLTHSNDQRIRMLSTSGGVVNELVRYLVSKEIIDKVLLTGYSRSSPIEADAMIIDKNTVNMLEQHPRDFTSRYVLVPTLQRLKEITSIKEKIAVVGTPCQINALTLWERANHDIFKIGIACSGGMSYKSSEQYKKSRKLQNAMLYYRGNGWPGKNTLSTDIVTVNNDHLGSLLERMYSSQIFMNPGCRRCYDQFAENADVSFCDFWNQKEQETETMGNSCVILRSHRANKIFIRMIEEGKIESIRKLSEKETILTQEFVLNAKKGSMRNTRTYQAFICITDLIFKLKLYKLFNIRIYRKLCAVYRRLCMRK